MAQADEPGTDTGTVIIDCDDCAVRGPGCKDCVVSVLLGVPDTLLADERAALEVLADVGLAPRLAAGADSPARRFRGCLTTRAGVGAEKYARMAVKFASLLDKPDAVS